MSPPGRQVPVGYRRRRLSPRRKSGHLRREQLPGCLPLALLAGSIITLLLGLGLVAALLVYRSALPLLAEPDPMTVLVMGIDRRPDESGPSRTDSLILMSIDPGSGRAAILSVPRDLWVNIPGVGEQRINTALAAGYQAENPDAGPRFAVETVESLFAVPVDRYALLDFETFVRLIDAVGGVPVDVPEPITDTQYPTPDYGVTTIHFDAGPQVLNGEQALIYARTRHADSDFGRSERQQQLIRSLASKLAQPENWPQLPEVYSILREGVQSNLTADDWRAMAELGQALADDQVVAATLDDGFTTPWITPGGAWVLLPNWPAIDSLVDQLFRSS